MIDVLALIQSTLDTSLSGIHSYWQRKADGTDPNEYIVYTLDGDSATYADGKPILRNANVTVRYYYRDTMLDTATWRTAIKTRGNNIVKALEDAGFSVPGGVYDVGDIDDVGFGTSIVECYFGRVT